MERARVLRAFHTTLGFPSSSRLAGIFRKRAYDLPPERIFRHPVKELARQLAGRLGFERLTRHETGWASTDAVYRDLDALVARRLLVSSDAELNTVYCYEDGAFATFLAARERGLQRCYELPIGYWKAWDRIKQEEAVLNPAWATQFQAAKDSPQKLERKEHELEQADTIFVASSFVRDTLSLSSADPRKVQVIPYGFASRSAPPPMRDPRRSGPLRALFVGRIDQRKGISYLFEAMETLRGKVTLSLAGPIVFRSPELERAIAPHRWLGVLPHSEVQAAMAAHDVLIFPSLFEGFGLVITEAMAQGMAVITTPHTAGPDLIEDGRDGFIVPIRSSRAIRDCLVRLLDEPALLASVGETAQAKAASQSWEAYAERVIDAIGAAPSMQRK